ncbi:helix-turn-helix domain-containing protein [Nonomuraea sp. SYSU D8015]|uniref:helix-turn-helix domain-containing protein n=1 Tax=Nonomuraea sp. SYSU D8015 TaxID=2593644 RepID=UPI0016602FB4
MPSCDFCGTPCPRGCTQICGSEIVSVRAPDIARELGIGRSTLYRALKGSRADQRREDSLFPPRHAASTHGRRRARWSPPN